MVENFHKKLREVISRSKRPVYIHYDEIRFYPEMWANIRKFNAAFGVRRGLRIATLTNKSFDTYCAIFSIILTGNVWVPIGSGSPQARILAMLDLAKPEILIVDREPGPEVFLFAAKRSIEIMEVTDPTSYADEAELEAVAVSPQDLAMIYFTSGSTGVPKGVPVTQDSLAINVENILKLVAIREGEIFGDYHDLSFVISLPILFPCAMSAGAISPTINQLDQLIPIRHIIENRISTLITVPSTIARIVKSQRGEAFPNLNILISCGEPLHLDILKAGLEHIGPGHMYNFYGSTEVGPWTFHHQCSHADLARFEQFGYLPIGKPMEGVAIRITDNEELLVAGRQVSPGYLGGVGADRFVMDEGKRWYHTGDKVLRHEDVYICKGRLDSQVKIAGHRVELLDVETHLRSMDGVENAICFTRGDDTKRHIVVVLVASGNLSLLEIRAHLKDKIPAYMLPRRVHCVESAPTNRSGKLDRLALRERFEA